MNDPQNSEPRDTRWFDGLSTIFFRNPRALLLVAGLVVVSGLTSLAILPRMEDPVIRQRAGLIVTRLPGADAERVEVLVTEPLEARIQEIAEIKKIFSESRPGISTIQVELRDEVIATDEVWSDVRAKINDAIAVLPAEASRPLFDEMEVRAYALIAAVTWQRDSPPNWTILRRLARQLEDELRSVSGTSIVDRFADPGEEITIDIDPERAATLGLDANQLAASLRSADAKNSAGQLHGNTSRMVIELENQFQQVEKIGETLVRAGEDGDMVSLADVATIRRGVPDPLPRFATVDGLPAVSVGAMVRPTERIDLWRPKAQLALDRFAEQLPAGIGIDIPLDQSRYVVSRLSSLAQNLVIGATAVVAVVLFLMGWRSAIVVALSLPLSALTVLFGLRVMEIPIHQMSVTGMIIALGLLIDNAIVAVDEVTVSIRKGKPRMDAVRDMVGSLALPLAGSTVTTALAFAPIAMMSGNAGEFVGAIAISVILAIFSSLFFALTVIPVLAAKTVVVDDEATTKWTPRWFRQGFSNGSMATVYRSLLTWLLDKPYRGVVAGLVLPIFGFSIAAQLPEQFFPPADRDQFHIQLELPVEASIQSTEAASVALTDMVERAGARKVSWFFGESAPIFYYNVINNRRGMPNFANAIVQMDSDEGITELLNQLQSRADALVPGARVLFRQLEQGPPFDAPIEIQIFGPDLQKLEELGQQVRQALAGAPDVIHTKAQLNETLPKIALDVDEAQARSIGLRPTDVASQLSGMLDGVPAGLVMEDTEQIPVRLRVGNARRSELNGIRTMQLTSLNQKLPLESIAEIGLEPEIAVIPRLNRRRMNQISGYITAGTLPSVSLIEYEKRLKASGFQLPQGYAIKLGGEESQRNDAVGNLMANVGVLGVLMVAVLVLSFGSFRLAGLILFVAACSAGLGMIGLWFGGYPFGFMALIGIMGLIGVAINDSIVVLASIQKHAIDNDSIDGRLPLDETVRTVMGCSRHVIATTLTTIAGFTPLIIDGGKFWPPLAIAIAGGVSGATLLALSLVPAVYRIIYCRNGTAANDLPNIESAPNDNDAARLPETPSAISA